MTDEMNTCPGCGARLFNLTAETLGCDHCPYDGRPMTDEKKAPLNQLTTRPATLEKNVALLKQVAKLEAELAEARSKLRDDDRRRQFMNGKEVARAVAEERKAQEKRRGLLRRQVDDLSKRLRGQQYFADASMRAKEKLEAENAKLRKRATKARQHIGHAQGVVGIPARSFDHLSAAHNALEKTDEPT